jgi:hypothetical protein
VLNLNKAAFVPSCPAFYSKEDERRNAKGNLISRKAKANIENHPSELLIYHHS